jgi:hypothetical protein
MQNTKTKLTPRQMAHSLARMLPNYMLDVDLEHKMVIIRYLRASTIAQEFCFGPPEPHRDFCRFLRRARNLGFTTMAAYSLDRCEPEMAPIENNPYSYFFRDPLPPPHPNEEIF